MRENCLRYSKCGAPLCPLDGKSLEGGIWYPDEEICRKQEPPDWVKVQKRIVGLIRDNERYFIFSMLNRNCIIGKGMEGLDPDKEEEFQLKRWMKNHPPKRQLSEKERQERRDRFKRNILLASKKLENLPLRDSEDDQSIGSSF